MLACRLCRIALSAPEGCAVCNPVRRNMVVLGETEEDRPSLSGTGNEALRAVRAQIKHHADILKTNPGNGKSESGLLACTNALAKLVGEVRKLQDDGYKAVEAMSFEERMKLFVGWYMDLTPTYRLTLREKMADHEVAVSKPVADEALS